MKIEIATLNDIHDLVLLVNSGYRGEASKKGWTTEADLLDGIRTDASSLENLLKETDSVILKYINDSDNLIGCVYLKEKGEGLYLGMLTVNPELQGAGIGKELLKASEVYGKEKGKKFIEMTVITVRTELIAWYKRYGYEETGEKRPFPEGDPRFGIPKIPLEFIVLEKKIG